MKTIETIKHIVAYEQKYFINEILTTVESMEKSKNEVEIQYSYGNEKYTALIIGRKVKSNGINNKSSKAIR